MKKTIISLLLAVVFSFAILSGCRQSKDTNINIQPELPQIKAICNLSTLECYYHTVGTIKKNKTDDQQFLIDYLKKDRTQWIEFTGIAKIGIDMDKVKMTINGDSVQITIPDAKLINSFVDQDSFVYYNSEDDWLVKNKINADLQTQAINNGQQEMEADILSNAALMNNAKIRAQKLIKNYIDEIGEVTGVKYKITWIDENGTTSTEIPEEEDVDTTGE